MLKGAPFFIMRERNSRIERFVCKVVISASMVLIGARFHCRVEKAATRLAELGREVTGLNRELLDRFYAGLGLGLCAVPAVGCILPFNQQGLGVGGGAIDLDAHIGGRGWSRGRGLVIAARQ